MRLIRKFSNKYFAILNHNIILENIIQKPNSDYKIWRNVFYNYFPFNIVIASVAYKSYDKYTCLYQNASNSFQSGDSVPLSAVCFVKFVKQLPFTGELGFMIEQFTGEWGS